MPVPAEPCNPPRKHPHELRRTASVIALLVVFGSGIVRAQDMARLNGYLEHQYSFSVVEGRWTHLDYDRLRVDLTAEAGRKTRIAAAAVAQIYRGDTRIMLTDALPDHLDPLVRGISIPIDDRFYLNHAFITLRPGPLSLTAGKQYLTWGAAFVFNPTELFRPKNVLEPTYEREGVGALSARLPLGTLSDVLVAFVPDRGLQSSGGVARMRHHVGGFDLSLLGALLAETGPSSLPGLLADEKDRRVTVGGDVTGEFLSLGIWAEAAWSDMGGARWAEATIGGNYTLADGTLLLVEGFYNGRGRWQAPYPAELWARRLFGGLRSLGKGAIYGMASRPVGERQLWTAGLSTLANPADVSAVIIPSASYAFAQDVDLTFNGFFYLGKDGDEFGGRRFGAFLRGRVYF